MPKLIPSSPIVRRDGVSQKNRSLAALDPDHARIDERTPRDLLSFAQSYGKELVYYNRDNQPEGAFDAFLGPDQDLDKLSALLADPQALPDERVRPHHALFLAFLKLLGGATEHLNTFARRHLDYHYRDVLGLMPRGPVPGQVHLLARLAKGKEEALLPKGTLLDAGKDSRGKPHVYSTDRDVVVSRAAIGRLSSVFVEREITTLKGAREANTGSATDALLAMLGLAFGEPRPGDAIPDYKGTEPVDATLLGKLSAEISFAKTHLYMEYYELGSVTRLLEKRAGEAEDWATVNGYLEEAARTRLNDPAYVFSPANPKDFAANLDAAVLGPVDYGALPDVLTIEDVYYQRSRQDVQDFIAQVLYLDPISFAAMMQSVLLIRAEWAEINRIVELCGRRKRQDETYSLSPADPSAFEQNLEAAVGPVDWTGIEATSLTEYKAIVSQIEASFFMPAEDFAFMMAVHDSIGSTDKEWGEVEKLLTEAFARKESERRRQAISAAGTTAATSDVGLRAVLTPLLDEPSEDDPLLVVVEKARPFLGGDADLQFLRTAAISAESPTGIASTEWARIAFIIEIAERRKGGWKKPALEKSTWLDIHAYEDATEVKSSLGIEGDQDTPRYKTFGAARASDDPEKAPAAVLGWVISSPLLALREGQRKIVITLGIQTEGWDQARIEQALAKGPFDVAISTAKGVQSAAVVSIAHGEYSALTGSAKSLSALRIEIELGPEKEAIAPLPSAEQPSVRVMLRPVWDSARGRFVTLYEAFEPLVIAAVHLSVEAKGLSALALENDVSVLDSKKPFLPFGASPAVGSRLFVAHPELCQKQLDSVLFHVEWMKAPADLAAHYSNYEITPDFKANVVLRDLSRDVPLTTGAALFAGNNAQDPHSISIASVPAALSAASPELVYGPSAAPSAQGAKASSWDRAFVFELTPTDFQHSVYPQVAGRKAAELAAKMATSTAGGTPVDVTAYQVAAPYTPTLKRLTADYTANAEIALDAAQGEGEHSVRHILPFGESPAPSETGKGAYFLPRHGAHEGELYIGLRDVRAPQTLLVLFQLAEGSADPDEEPATVEWSYLDGNRFVELHDGQILADGTRGLIGTGILELSLPEAAPSKSLPEGFYWLRAAVRRHARSICDIVAIHTQVVPATSTGRDNAPDLHEAPTPAGTITKLLTPVRGIACVEQPYASFGHSPEERAESFATRVSERLRHKQRALSIWDYERLVLERFPRIYKVKCIPRATADEPGLVRLIVIPSMKGQIPFDPFAPKAPLELLESARAYLADKSPPEARVVVQNAVFIGVRVRVLVRFRPGYDEGFYSRKLDDEICRFLSPWAYDEGVDIVMGNRIYASSLIDFIERRPYIDFVAGITLYTGQGEVFTEVPRPETGGYYVAAEQPDEILVAARGHEIDTRWQYMEAIPEDVLLALQEAAKQFGAAAGSKGIGSMQISLDFILSTPVLSGGGIEGSRIEVSFTVG